jgi:hypothetical protein
MCFQSALADLVSSAELVYFGTQPRGSTTVQYVTITNNGTTLLTNLTLEITGYQNAIYISQGCGEDLSPNETCFVELTFTPDRPRQFRNRLNVDAESTVGGVMSSYSLSIRLEGATAK